MDMGKFNQLKRIREKMEKIFFGAGGKTKNLKKAILSGKGNRDRKVILNGLGEVIHPVYDEDDLQTILGDEIYYDEMVDDSVNGLGVVATASTGTAVAAASGIIGSIAALIKKLGSLFKKGTPQAEREIVQENTDNQEEKTRKFSVKNLISNFQNKNGSSPPDQSLPATTDFEMPTDDFSQEAFARSAEMPEEDNAKDNPDEKKGIVGWVKKNPMLTAGIAAGVIGGAVLIAKAVKKKKGLSGVPKKRKTSTAKSRKTSSPKKKVTAKKKTPAKKRVTKPKRKTTTRRRSSVKKIELL